MLLSFECFLLPFATFWPRDSYTAFCCVFERKTVHFCFSQERQGKRIRRTETSQSDLSKGHIAETILSNFWIAELIKNSRRRRNHSAVVDVGTEWQKTNAKTKTKTPTRRRKFAFQTWRRFIIASFPFCSSFYPSCFPLHAYSSHSLLSPFCPYACTFNFFNTSSFSLKF